MNEKTKGASHHVPVLLRPAIAGLNLDVDGCYVDGTFGRGGHSGAILDELGAGGRLFAIDRDPEAIANAPGALLTDPRFRLVRKRFSELEQHASEERITGQVDGLLLDLGVSSPQLDEARRGFSIRADGPLDMRMDPDRGQSAADWLATVDEKTLSAVIRKFGEEPAARRIAAAIIAARNSAPIGTTSELAEIVAAAAPRGKKRIHPATRTFQAIRIFLNEELDELRTVLDASLRVLARGGRLCVITFHSLEDRIVKRFMRDASREPIEYRGMPDVPAHAIPPLRIIGKPITGSETEIDENPRARSARLRIAERC